MSVSRDDSTGKMRATPEPLKSRSPRINGGTLPSHHHRHHTPGCTYDHHLHDGSPCISGPGSRNGNGGNGGPIQKSSAPGLHAAAPDGTSSPAQVLRA